VYSDRRLLWPPASAVGSSQNFIWLSTRTRARSWGGMLTYIPTSSHMKERHPFFLFLFSLLFLCAFFFYFFLYPYSISIFPNKAAIRIEAQSCRTPPKLNFCSAVTYNTSVDDPVSLDKLVQKLYQEVAPTKLQTGYVLASLADLPHI